MTLWQASVPSVSNRNLFKLRAQRVRRPGQRQRGDLGDCDIAGERPDLYARAAEGHIQTNGPLGGAQAAPRDGGGGREKEKEDRGEVREVGGGGGVRRRTRAERGTNEARRMSGEEMSKKY